MMCTRSFCTDGVAEMMQKRRRAGDEGEGEDESSPEDIMVLDVIYETVGILVESVAPTWNSATA